MSTVVDRRKTEKKKNLANRQRFIERARASIKKAIRNNIDERSIKDTGKGGRVRIPNKGTTEPTFQNGQGGQKSIVVPGNPKNLRGDKIPRPKSGQGGAGKGPGSKDPIDMLDEYEFTLSREEFLNFFFEDLELPDLVKTALKDITAVKWCRAGFTTVGIPSNLDVGRSYTNALARKFALSGSFDRKIEALKNEPGHEEEIELLEKQKKTIPFLDDVDLRYRLFLPTPKPITNAVMFCLMDVSGSMGEYEKDLAKRFFMLLYLFLERKYDKVDVVFIRHTTEAKEVDENEFFYSKESGGTVVSTALELASDIIRQRYNTSDWNIYISQCSDGDNSYDDNDECEEIIKEDLLPYIQHYAYVQVGHERDENANMWGVMHGRGSSSANWSLLETMKQIAADSPKMNVKMLDEPKDIYPVFSELFEKEVNK